MSRTCLRCGLGAPNVRFQLGGSRFCVTCISKDVTQKRRERPDLRTAHNSYVNRWRIENPERTLFTSAKKHAREIGVPFTITLEDIRIPKVCPVFGFHLRPIGGPRQDDTLSLDRIVSSLGYVKGNVWVVSWRANCLKRDGTLEEFRRLLNGLERKNLQQKSHAWFTRVSA